MRGWIVVAVLVSAGLARAGGLEFPDIGTEARGRGAAFTAKADDLTAIHYNVAGLARQRGTRLLVNLNVVFHKYEFIRDGVYPDDPSNPATPWGGQPFPLVRDTGGPFAAPLLGLSTDFGILDRWTFAIGLFTPSSVGNRTYPLGVDGKPSPSRYDNLQALPLVVYPTLAAAVRLTRWLDLGVALHVVYGRFDLKSVSFTDLGRGLCPNYEYQPCDARNDLVTSGVTATASLGVMARPARWLQLGAHVRAPFVLDTEGTVNATAPQVTNMTIEPSPARFKTGFPWIFRFGVRFLHMKGAHEAFDVEADATYENWSAADAQGHGPKVEIPELSIFRDIKPTILHDYKDTFSLRLGGSGNIRLPAGVLSLRAGVFYDSSATSTATTRLDFDTLEKVGITAGLGYRYRGFVINVAYAHMFEPERVVTDGAVRPINGAQGGQPIDVNGNPFPAVNNGRYQGRNAILSIGVAFAWDELLGRKRPVRYGQPWELDAAPTPPRPQAPPPAPEETSVAPAPEPEAVAMTFEPDPVKRPLARRRPVGRRR